MKRLEALCFILGGILFVALLRRFGIHPLMEALAGQGSRFLLILLPTAGSYLLFCLAWWLTLDPLERRDLTFPRLFLISMAGFSLNYITPFIALGGEPLKMAMLSRRVGRLRAISSVLAYNALHVLSHLFVFVTACTMGFWLLRLSTVRIVTLAAGACVSAALAAALLTCHERGLAEHVLAFLRRIRVVRGSSERQKEWQDTLEKYDQSVRSFYRTRRRDFWVALGADYLGRSVWTFEIAIMIHNLGRTLDPLRAYFVHSIDSMMMVATFFVPYEMGVKEGAFCLILRWLGLDPSLGIYVGVVSRVREIIWIAAGLAIMAALGVRRFPSLSRGPNLPEERG